MGIMRCGGCGAENRDGAKFCGECGERLEKRCRRCNIPLSEGLKFCDECGTPVADGDVTDDHAQGGAARKSVTVAFVDLGGSTAFGEVVDAETARSVMGRYHSLVTEAVETHRGTVAKYIGDGVMVFFGVPEVAEDDAVRAVAFGADVQERFTPFAARVLDRHGATVTLRVGINTGEIVIGDDDVDLYGDALNVAARLEKACPDGGVLVGEETWRLARGTFAFDTQGEIEVHGRAGVVRPYLLALDAVVEEQTAPFVGRADELDRLGQLFTRAIATRRPVLASVIGPAGVGKTRLSRELQSLVEADGAVVYTTVCDRDGDATLGPIADLLRPDQVADADTVRANLTDLLDRDGVADRIVEGLLAVLGLAKKKVSVEETFWALRHLVERLGREAPVVVVVDDIQWASDQLLDLFEHLVTYVEDTPLLLVTLARPEIRDLRPDFATTGRHIDELVLLTGLDAGSTATLAARLLGTDELPRGLAERLPASTDGNPLFVREVVRMLVDERIVRKERDQWVLTVEPDAIDVPPTIQTLLAARVERLPAEERVVLERAAVIGPDFTRGGLEHLCNPIERSALPHVLRSLTRKELIEATGSYWGDDPVHRFHHVLIRDAVYRRLLKEQRAALHERIGDWMTHASADVLGEHDAAIGHHLEQAFRYRTELSDDADDLAALGTRAARRLTAAAAVALAGDDTVAAGALARRALECLRADAPDRPPALTLACETLLDAGDATAARPFIEELRALADLSPAFAGWAKAYDAQAITVAEPDRLADAEVLATEAVEAMAELDDAAGRAKARLVRAAILARRGRIGECEAELDVALTDARAAKDTRRVVSVLGVAPLAALWGPSPVARAGGRCLDVLRLLRITASSPAVEAVALRCQAVLEALRGRFDTAESLIDRAHDTVEQLGLRRELADIAMARGQIHLLADDPASAEAPLRDAHDELAAIGASAEASQAAALLGRALLRSGRTDEVEALVDEAERLAGENLKSAILGRTVRAEWLLATGRAERARSVAERAVAIAETTDLVLDHADACEILDAVRGQPSDAARRLRERKGIGATSGDDASQEQRVAASTPSPPASTPAAEGAADGAGDATLDGWMEAAMRRMSTAWRSGDHDAWRAHFTADPVVDVARPVGAASADGADAFETMWSLRDLLPENEIAVEVTSPLGVAMGRVRFHDDAGNEVEMCTVLEFDERLIERLTTFDGDDLAGARTLFEQRVRERGGTLDGVDRLDVVVPELREHLRDTPIGTSLAEVRRTWSEGDVDGLRQVYGWHDITHEYRRPVPNSGGFTGPRVADAVAVTRAAFPNVERSEVLAVRGEHMALAHWISSDDLGNRLEMLVLSEVDADALVTRAVFFEPPDRIAEAVALLDEWYLASDDAVGREQLHLGGRLVSVLHDRGRHDELPALIADDFRGRYPAGWGTGDLDRDEWLEVSRSLVDALAREMESWTAWLVWGEPAGDTETTGISRRRARAADGSTSEWVWATAAQIDDGRFRRIDILPIESLDEARARAREFALQREHGGSSPPHSGDSLDRYHFVVPELRRVVDGTPYGEMCRYQRRAMEGEAELHAWLYGRDDVVVEDRRAVVNVGAHAGSSVLHALADIPRFYPRIERTEILAVRGDRFGVGQVTFGDDDGNEYAFLAVDEVDGDGRLIRSTHFDSDRIMDAVALLDAWHHESHDAVGREVGSVGSHVLAANHDPSRRDELLHLLPEDVVIRFADELASWGEVSREDYLTIADTLTAEATHIDYWAVWFEPLSENVSFSVLRRTATMPDGTTPEWLFAVAWETLDGQGRHADLFPIELLDRARTRAREMNGLGAFGALPSALEGQTFVEAPEWNEAVRWRLRMLAFFNDRDRDPSVQLFRDDAQILDHRPLVRAESSGRSELVAYGRALLELMDAEIDAGSIGRSPFRLAGVLDVAGDRLCLTAEFVLDVLDNLHLIEVDDDGLLLRTATFDPEQLDEARTMLAEWHLESASTTTDDPLDRNRFVVPDLRRVVDATPYGEMLRNQLRAWDGDESLRQWLFGRDDLRLDDRRSVVNLGAGTGSSASGVVSDFADVFTRWVGAEVLAVRGTRHGVARVTFDDDAGNEYAVLAVDEADEDGRIVRSTYFDHDAIADAVALLDEWYLESDDAVSGELFRVGAAALTAAHDPERRDELLALLADDVVFELDVRPLASFGETDRAGYLAILDTLALEAEHIDFWTVWAEPCSESVAFSVLRRVASLSDGSTAEWTFAAATEIRNGRVQRCHLAEVEDMDRVRARAEQMAGAPADPLDRIDFVVPELRRLIEGTPTESNIGFVGAYETNDQDRLSWFYGRDDLVVENRMSTINSGTSVGEDALAGMLAAREVFPNFDTAELIAVRGTRFGVSRCTCGDDNGNLYEFISVSETDADGRFVRLVFLDPDRITAAVELLDEWYVGSADAGGVDVLPGSSLLHSTHDPERRAEFLSRLADDVVVRIVDSASLSHDLDRDRFIEAQDGLTNEAERVDFWAVWTEPHGDTVLCSLLRRIAIMGDGSTGEWVAASVQRFVDGRVVLRELYPADQLDRARARAAELARMDLPAADDAVVTFAEPSLADVVPDLPWWPSALRTVDEWSTSPEALIEWLYGRDDVWAENVMSVVNSGVLRGHEVVELGLGLQAAYPRIAMYEIAAVRGTHLSRVLMVLVDRDGFNEFAAQFVIEVGDDGRVVRQMTFDADDETRAQATLDAWHRESESGGAPVPSHDVDAPTVWRSGSAMRMAWEDGDLDRIRAMFAPDAEILAYRSVVSAGHTAGDGAVEAMLAFHEFLPHLAYTPISWRGQRLALGRMRFHDGHDSEVDMVVVTEVHTDGMFRRAATFDPTDERRAEALLDDWFATSASGTDQPVPHAAVFGNRATWVGHGMQARVWQTHAHALSTPARLGLAPEMLAPDVERVDHRPLGTGELRGRDEILASQQALFDVGFDRTEDIALVEEDGDARCLFTCAFTNAAGDRMEQAILIEVDDHDRIVQIDIYDPADLDDALVE